MSHLALTLWTKLSVRGVIGQIRMNSHCLRL